MKPQQDETIVTYRAHLEDVCEDRHGRVDGVRDDEEAGVRAALGALLGDALHDRGVGVEKVVAGNKKQHSKRYR